MRISQSHGGSGRQARAVIDGLPADVVTLALAGDIDKIATEGKLLPLNWEQRLPHNSAPYVSTIVFLVRAGNPKKIRDWGDLVRDDVQVITPNPKTSGGARWNYLGAWAWAEKQPGANEASAREFVRKLYKNVPVLDTGARGSLTTFAQRGIGDVAISWENEAHLALRERGSATLRNRRAVDQRARGTVGGRGRQGRAAARHARRRRRPTSSSCTHPKARRSPRGISTGRAMPRSRRNTPASLRRWSWSTIDHFGGWKLAQKEHFATGGVFDQIMDSRRPRSNRATISSPLPACTRTAPRSAAPAARRDSPRSCGAAGAPAA